MSNPHGTPSAFVLIPRDGLFLKDGREWATSGFGHAHSLHWPFPSTVLGAMRTAFGRVIEADGKAALSPQRWRALAEQIVLDRTVALRRRLLGGRAEPWSVAHRCWSVPADALFLKPDAERGLGERIQRLHPRKPPADHPQVESLGREVPNSANRAEAADFRSADVEHAREKLWRATVDEQSKPDRSPAWWSNPVFEKWLVDPLEKSASRDNFSGFDALRRIQAHVGISPETRTSIPQLLFAHDVVETLERSDVATPGGGKDSAVFEWAIGCEVRVTGNLKAPEGRLLLGGSRIPARIETAPAALFEMPNKLKEAFRGGSNGLRLIAVTPLAFESGWLPDGFEPQAERFVGRVPGIATAVILRAGLVPRPAHVSGWDLSAGAPKPTKRLVPAGSVYFFEKENSGAFTLDEAQRLWLAPFGARQDRNDSPLGDWIDQGLGRVVPGIWNPQGAAR